MTKNLRICFCLGALSFAGTLGPGCGVDEENTENTPTTEQDPSTDGQPIGTVEWSPGLVTFIETPRSYAIRCQWIGNTGGTRFGDTGSWPIRAENGCNTRVWLHENGDGSGAGLCLSPHTNTGTLHRTWRQWYISPNTSRCP
jgi:hypothetical protein